MPYAAVSLGLFILIFAYFTLNAPQSTPESRKPAVDLSQQSQGTPPPAFVDGYCQTVQGNAPTFRAPADNVKKQGDDDIDPSAGRIIEDPKHCGGPRNQIGDMTTYRLIRKNVPMTVNDAEKPTEYLWDNSSCHFQSAEKLDIPIEGVNTSQFKVFYPQIHGEIDAPRMLHSRTRDVESSYLYFIDYRIVFLLHLNPDGSYVELKGSTTGGDNVQFYLADIYQDIESPDKGELPPESFACDTSIATTGTPGSGTTSPAQVIQPGQDISQTRDQLQLQYFVFGTATTPQGITTQLVNGWGVHCKPAVYLYPEQKQLVNVKVFPKGELSYTDPPYDPVRGWTVQAFPNGQLLTVNDERITNNYLYYESKILDSEIDKPTKGWSVKKDQMAQLFNEILPKLGLNKKEQKDFSDYWLTKLPNSPYYFVGLVEKEQRDYLEALQVTPNPETSIRFSLFFEMLDQPKIIEEPVIKTPTRDGFTLVDWGGMVKLHPGTPFTCSQ